MRRGDIITAARDLSWIPKGKKYLVGGYLGSKHSVSVKIYAVSEEGMYATEPVYQEIDSRLWENGWQSPFLMKGNGVWLTDNIYLPRGKLAHYKTYREDYLITYEEIKGVEEIHSSHGTLENAQKVKDAILLQSPAWNPKIYKIPY